MQQPQAWILNVGAPDAVRRVPISAISLTGSVLGKQFESSLERDLIMFMAFQEHLDWFQVQPVKIAYKDRDGRKRTYTPDLLVSFLPPPAEAEDVCTPEDNIFYKPRLCEVKYREDLRKDWALLKPKFKAARAYARKQGWEFRIYTEDRIRTEALKNVHFLWSYQFAHFEVNHWQSVVDYVYEAGAQSIEEVLTNCFGEDETRRGEGLWTIWCMLGRANLRCDMNLPLGLDTIVWLNSSFFGHLIDLPDDEDDA